MARIRSIHPGLWTDEAFVTCSPLARLLFIGLWNEADDQGVFEWKPTMLKMRLLPVDNVDVPGLLSELGDANAIEHFMVDERRYGAIRNFRKFQRPKSPNAIHPLPPELRSYVSLAPAISEITPSTPPPNGETPAVELELFPPTGEIAAQMEDGGGRRKEGRKEQSADADSSSGDDPTVTPDDVREAFEAYNARAKRYGLPIARDLTEERRRKIRARLRSSGGLAAWIEALQRIGDSSFLTGRTERGFRADLEFLCQTKSFQRLIEGYYADTKGSTGRTNGNGAHAPPELESFTEQDWVKRVNFARRKQLWSRLEWGPRPNEPGCLVPAHLIQPGDGQGWAENDPNRG